MLGEFGELADISEMLAILAVLEQREVFGSQSLPAGDARQNLRHETAARMGDQMNPGILGQDLRERQGVGKRALADRRVIERVDAVAVVLEQGLHARRMQRPQLAEGARGVDERTVRENQYRRAVRRRRYLGDFLALVLQAR